MPKTGEFLCGCSVESKKRYAATMVSLANGDMTISFGRKDEQGFEVCPEHGVRLKNYRSPVITGPQGNQVRDYSKMSTGSSLKLKFAVSDKRDMRDPEEIGVELLNVDVSDNVFGI